jgi:hypothetical protein
VCHRGDMTMHASPSALCVPLHPNLVELLNLVEPWFAELTNKKLRCSAHRNTRELANDIITWAEHWNDNPRPFVWRKTADEILQNLKRYCQRISDSRH